MPDQSEFYPYGPFGAWRNRTAKGGVRVLAGDDFAQMRLVDYYENLAKHCGRDFKNIRWIGQYFPLFHDGLKHKQLRKIAAVHLKARASHIPAFEASTVALFKDKLRAPGRVEVISELIIPMVENLSIALTGLDYIKGISAIAIGNNSLKVTRHIDERIGYLFEMSQARFPEDSADEQGIRVAYTMLGAEPLGATISQSMAKILRGVTGQKISELDWSEDFSATGLTSIFRECKHQPVDLGGDARAVKSVEVDLACFLSGKGAMPRHIFGVGNHACLGRSLALSIWGQIVTVLRRSEMKVKYISETAGNDKFLEFPATFTIEVY